jgi:hypothetical protein
MRRRRRVRRFEIFHRRSRNAKSQTTTLEEAHKQPARARSFEGCVDHKLSELP